MAKRTRATKAPKSPKARKPAGGRGRRGRAGPVVSSREGIAPDPTQPTAVIGSRQR